jgi:hypothetical protein
MITGRKRTVEWESPLQSWQAFTTAQQLNSVPANPHRFVIEIPATPANAHVFSIEP